MDRRQGKQTHSAKNEMTELLNTVQTSLMWYQTRAEIERAQGAGTKQCSHSRRTQESTNEMTSVPEAKTGRQVLSEQHG